MRSSLLRADLALSGALVAAGHVLARAQDGQHLLVQLVPARVALEVNARGIERRELRGSLDVAPVDALLASKQPIAETEQPLRRPGGEVGAAHRLHGAAHLARRLSDLTRPIQPHAPGAARWSRQYQRRPQVIGDALPSAECATQHARDLLRTAGSYVAAIAAVLPTSDAENELVDALLRRDPRGWPITRRTKQAMLTRVARGRRLHPACA